MPLRAARDGDALGQAGLAVDHQRVVVGDQKGRRAGHASSIVDGGGQVDGPAVDRGGELDGVVAGAGLTEAVGRVVNAGLDRVAQAFPRRCRPGC